MLRALSPILLFGDRTKATTALVYHRRSSFSSFQLRHRTSIQRGMMGFSGPTSSQAMTFSRAALSLEPTRSAAQMPREAQSALWGRVTSARDLVSRLR
jgi:hypothetical protein